MALTITIEGLGKIADGESGDYASWGITGSGGASITNDTEVFYQGAACVSSALSSGKYGWIWYNYGSGLNFQTTYAGQRVYIWYQCTTPGKMNTKANAGLAIRIGTNTTNFRTWTLAGSDDLNGYSGGWKCAIIDPTLTGSISDTGSYNTASLQYFGIYYNGSGAARSNNIFVDTIAIGKGIRVTGTSSTMWGDIVTYCAQTLATRAWGMVQQREGIYYIYGNVYIGGSASIDTVASSSGKVIKWGDSQYWTGSAWASGMGNSFNGLTIADHASHKTEYTDGVLVGSDGGRSGNVYVSSTGINTTILLYGGNYATSLTYLYGCIFQGITGGFTWGNDADHRCYGVTFQACTQFNPVGAPKIKNCIFTETVSTAGALLWNASIDIAKCKFIANTTGAGIQQTSAAGSPYTFTDLTFSGNTYDVNNTSGSSIEDQKSGTSDPTTYTGSTTTFTASTTLNIYLVDADGAAITVDCEVTVVKNSDGTVLHHEDGITDGLTSYNYTTGGGTVTYIVILNTVTYQPKIVNNYALPSSGTVNLTIQLDTDPFYSNPA